MAADPSCPAWGITPGWKRAGAGAASLYSAHLSVPRWPTSRRHGSRDPLPPGRACVRALYTHAQSMQLARTATDVMVADTDEFLLKVSAEEGCCDLPREPDRVWSSVTDPG